MAFGKKKAVEPELDLKNQPVPEGSHLLEVDDLKMYFHTGDGVVKAVDGVTYTLDRGETLGVVGESGSGKSVTAMTIMGLIEMPPGKIEGGDVRYRGKSLLKMSEREMQQIRGNDIAMVFQDPMTSLNPVYTIGRQLGEGLRLHRGYTKEQATKRAVELLDMVGIPNPEQRVKDYPHQFSGGMRQRAMIAIALGARPKLLLADEPTTALDVTIQDQIMKLLNQLKQELGMSIILVTHDLGVIAQMCDRVAVMYAGQIVEMTDTVTLFSRPRHPYTYGLMGSLPNEETAGTTLEAIKGSPPNLAHLPEGCPFSPRCKYACDLCRRERPALTEVEPGHLARCHRLDVTASFQGLIEVPDGAGRKEDTPHG